MKISTAFLFIILFSFSGVMLGAETNTLPEQDVPPLYKTANKKFANQAYSEAIAQYEQLLSEGFAPAQLRRNLAYSYLMINEPVKAEELYAQLIDNFEAQVGDLYNYAQALKQNRKYEKADQYIEEYRILQNNDSRGMLQYDGAKTIEEIYNNEKYEVRSVYFNSEFSDFGAVVLDDKIYFTSDRNENAVIQYKESRKGNPYLDVYSVDERRPINYNRANKLSKGINSKFHDGPITFNFDGTEVYITRNKVKMGLPKYGKDDKNHFVIYSAIKKKKGWTKMKELSFNSADFSCGHPSISVDNDTLYFASDMPGGFGGSDIYYVTRTQNGWSKPVNMGATVNTEGDELFPFISARGQLYYSSNGQLGLGGLDIFKISLNQEGSYTVTNMGYPLNSSSDDFSFYLLPDGKNGYFSSNRPGGKGEDDIYKFEILDKE